MTDAKAGLLCKSVSSPASSQAIRVIRTTSSFFTVIVLVLLTHFSSAALAHSDEEPCTEAAHHLAHEFESGARWDLCFHITNANTLALYHVAYGAPDEPKIFVLENISIASLLLHYDADIDPINLLHRKVGEQAPQVITDADCEGTRLADSVCLSETDLGQLNRHANEPVLRRHAVTLTSILDVGAHTYRIDYTLTEDGRIDPGVAFSGRINRFVDDPQLGTVVRDDGAKAASATHLFVWRIDFNLDDTPNNDIVTEYQFNPDTQERKLMQASRLAVETFRKVQPETFRGWRISDLDRSSVAGGSTRIGYYLDPQPSGFGYRHADLNWAQFDVFVTQNRACEQFAINPDDDANCGRDLDDYINGELLDAADPVVWYSLTRRWQPNSADWPAIRTRETRFSLIPFDWSASSPFFDPTAGEP